MYSFVILKQVLCWNRKLDAHWRLQLLYGGFLDKEMPSLYDGWKGILSATDRRNLGMFYDSCKLQHVEKPGKVLPCHEQYLPFWASVPLPADLTRKSLWAASSPSHHPPGVDSWVEVAVWSNFLIQLAGKMIPAQKGKSHTWQGRLSHSVTVHGLEMADLWFGLCGVTVKNRTVGLICVPFSVWPRVICSCWETINYQTNRGHSLIANTVIYPHGIQIISCFAPK